STTRATGPRASDRRSGRRLIARSATASRPARSPDSHLARCKVGLLAAAAPGSDNATRPQMLNCYRHRAVRLILALGLGLTAGAAPSRDLSAAPAQAITVSSDRSEEHTSELQSPYDLVCRLLLEKKKKKNT